MNNKRIISSKKMPIGKQRVLLYGMLIFSAPVFFTFMNIGIFIKPLLLIPLCLCVSMHEKEGFSAFYGMLCGLLLDISCGKPIGFNTCLLMLFCVCSSILFTHLLKVTFLSFVVLCAFVSFIQTLSDYFFYYYIKDYEDSKILLRIIFIPVWICTSASAVLIYPAVKLLYARLGKPKLYL